MKYKAITMETKVNHEKRLIEGYASTFGNKDRVDDIVQPGAFKKTISERFDDGRKKDIKVLWQHFHPIGLPIHMEEDEKGLYTVSKIANTPQGDEALALAAEGVIDKMSIGYDIIKSEPKGKVNLLHELKLYEYSLVTFPANEEASILSATKGMGIGMTVEEMHRVLKEFSEVNINDLLTESGTLSIVQKKRIENAIETMNSSIDALAALIEEAKGGSEPQNAKMDPYLLQSIRDSFKI